MDGIIQIDVKGSYVAKDTSRGGVQGEANVTDLRICFSADWLKFADKKVSFYDACGVFAAETNLTDELLEEKEVSGIYLVPIPGEAMREGGWFTFIIDGYSGNKHKRSAPAKLKADIAPGEE